MRKHERQGCLRQVLEPADSSPRNPTTPEIQLATILRGRPERALANRHHPLPTRDDTDVEILIILDDRSRLCIDSRARGIFTDGDVDTVFTAATSTYGDPAGLLPDNGTVFTGAPRKGGRGRA